MFLLIIVFSLILYNKVYYNVPKTFFQKYNNDISFGDSEVAMK